MAPRPGRPLRPAGKRRHRGTCRPTEPDLGRHRSARPERDGRPPQRLPALPYRLPPRNGQRRGMGDHQLWRRALVRHLRRRPAPPASRAGTRRRRDRALRAGGGRCFEPARDHRARAGLRQPRPTLGRHHGGAGDVERQGVRPDAAAGRGAGADGLLDQRRRRRRVGRIAHRPVPSLGRGGVEPAAVVGHVRRGQRRVLGGGRWRRLLARQPAPPLARGAGTGSVPGVARRGWAGAGPAADPAPGQWCAVGTGGRGRGGLPAAGLAPPGPVQARAGRPDQRPLPRHRQCRRGWPLVAGWPRRTGLPGRFRGCAADGRGAGRADGRAVDPFRGGGRSRPAVDRHRRPRRAAEAGSRHRRSARMDRDQRLGCHPRRAGRPDGAGPGWHPLAVERRRWPPAA